MRSPAIAITIFVFALALGFGGGYFVQKARTKPIMIDKIITCPEQPTQTATEDRTEALKRINLELDLLKKYINLVMLPKNSIEDPLAYAKEMRTMVEELGDSEVNAKYVLTAETSGREVKILDLFNTLIDKVRAEAR